MIGPLAITKLPTLSGDAALFDEKSGWWDPAHESRTDCAQLYGSLFLVIVGADAYSLDARLARARSAAPAEPAVTQS
ncbi:hypothetical protein [Streptomyces sp. NPDC085466]|uniref:hypothetical protein n=1 Tax=Streptomyces sp. NPDC085466 TaxID=3365725 RepID=UPI0037CDAD99